MSTTIDIDRRAQDCVIERLATMHGGLHVDEGFADGSVRVTTPDGFVWRISPVGVEHFDGRNTAINWTHEGEDYVPPCHKHKVEDCSDTECQIDYALRGF